MAQFLQSYGWLIAIGLMFGVHFLMMRGHKHGSSGSGGGMGMMGCCGMGGMNHDEHDHSAELEQLKSDNQKMQDEIQQLKNTNVPTNAIETR